MNRVKVVKLWAQRVQSPDFFNRRVKPAAVPDNYIRYNNGIIPKKIIPKVNVKITGRLVCPAKNLVDF